MADDRLWPEHFPRLQDGDVVLAYVDTVCVAGAGQVRVVIDDEEGAVGVAEASESARRALDHLAPQLLLAQLHDLDAAAQRGAQQRFGLFAARQGVADEVEARGTQALAAQRAIGLWGGKAHKAIIA